MAVFSGSADGFFFAYDGTPESPRFRSLAELALQRTNNTTVVIVANMELDARLRALYTDIERHFHELGDRVPTLTKATSSKRRSSAECFSQPSRVSAPTGAQLRAGRLQVKQLALFVSHALGGANAYDDQPGAYEEYMRQVHTLPTLPKWVLCGV